MPKTAIYKIHQGSAIPRGLLSNADSFPVKVNVFLKCKLKYYLITVRLLSRELTFVCLQAIHFAFRLLFWKDLHDCSLENALIMGGFPVRNTL